MPPDRVGKKCGQRLVYTEEDIVRRFSEKRKRKVEEGKTKEDEKAKRRCSLAMVKGGGR